MGRYALHTREQVFEAANQLVAIGQAVSPTTLRAALGGGSLTTLSKHLSAWQPHCPPVSSTTTATLPATVEKAFAHAWQLALAEAQQEITVIREQSEAAAKDMRQHLEETLKQIAQKEAEAEAVTAKIEILAAKLAASRAETTQAKADATARETALIAGLKPLQQAFEAQQAECRELKKENKNLIAQCAKLQGQCETWQAQCNAKSARSAKTLPGKNRKKQSAQISHV